MGCCDSDREFQETRLENLRALILAYDEAFLAMATAGPNGYSFNTGQTTVTVTQGNIDSFRLLRGSLANEYETLRIRLGCGIAVFQGRPTP